MDKIERRVLVCDYSLDTFERAGKGVFTKPRAVDNIVTASRAPSVAEYFRQRSALGATRDQFNRYKKGHRFCNVTQRNVPFRVRELREFSDALGVRAEDLVDFDRSYAFHGVKTIGARDPQYSLLLDRLHDALQEYVVARRRDLLKKLYRTLRSRQKQYTDARLRRLQVRVHVHCLAVDDRFMQKRRHLKLALGYNRQLLEDFHGTSEDCIALARLARLAIRLRLLGKTHLNRVIGRAIKYLKKHSPDSTNAGNVPVHRLICCEQASYVHRARKILHEEENEVADALSREEQMITTARLSYRLDPSRPEAMLCYALAIRGASGERKDDETNKKAENLLIEASKFMDPASIELVRFYRIARHAEKAIDAFDLYRDRWSTNALLRVSELYAESVKLLYYRTDFDERNPTAEFSNPKLKSRMKDAIKLLERSILAGFTDFRKVSALAFLSYKFEGKDSGMFKWQHLQLPRHRSGTWDLLKVIDEGIRYAEAGNTKSLQEIFIAGAEFPESWSAIGTFAKDCMGDEPLAIRCYSAGLRLGNKNVELLLNHSRLLLNRNEGDDLRTAIDQLARAKSQGKATHLQRNIKEQFDRANDLLTK